MGVIVLDDPYYLAQKAQEIGYHPEIILSGRRLNDSMGYYVADQVIKLLVKHNINIKDSEILILGFTFKENCPDFRNTKVIDVINKLKDFGTKVDVYDPLVDCEKSKSEYNLQIYNKVPSKKYDAVVLAVSHDNFVLWI